MALSSLDAALFTALNAGLNVPLLDSTMVFITNYNVIVFLAFFLLVFRREGGSSLVTLLLASTAFVITDWSGGQLKDVFMRPRPCQALDEIVLLVKCTGLSMPSNHAANSFAFALPFVIMSKERVRWIMLGFAAIVAYSRIYVGVHYPGDVAVGAILGASIAIGIVFIYRFFKGAKTSQKTGTSEPDGDKSVSS